jgi:hypothetical protein
VSIVIAGVFENRVLIASDTYCAAAAGPVSKIWPLPHLPAVIAGRGSARFLAEVAMAAGSIGLDFDALSAALPEDDPVARAKSWRPNARPAAKAQSEPSNQEPPQRNSRPRRYAYTLPFPIPPPFT